MGLDRRETGLLLGGCGGMPDRKGRLVREERWLGATSLPVVRQGNAG